MKEQEPKCIDAWEFTLQASMEPPIYGKTIIDRFTISTVEQPVTLFVPWGVSPLRTYSNNYDQAALDQIKRYSLLLARYGVPNEVMIMPADLYATEINRYDLDLADQYCYAIAYEADDRGFSVKPWSKIREQNMEQYESILRYECSPDALPRSTPKALWYRSLLPASISRNSDRGEDAVRESAFRYLQERISEARIIESVYAPVKLSMVTPTKDNIVDRELPRLYILEDSLRFPWLTE